MSKNYIFDYFYCKILLSFDFRNRTLVITVYFCTGRLSYIKFDLLFLFFIRSCRAMMTEVVEQIMWLLSS